MSDWDFYDWSMALVWAAFIAFMVWLGVSWSKDTDRLMAQCAADGHKEYECASMLRRGRR